MDDESDYFVQTPSILDLSEGIKEIKLGDSTIQYGSEKNGYVKIYSIRTPQSKRNRGSARNAMDLFLKETDKLGKNVKLDCSSLDKKTNDRRLFDFYKSLGFVPTGRVINSFGDPEMERIVKK
jgi:hypothetical protein